jgi:hypothetical protein
MYIYGGWALYTRENRVINNLMERKKKKRLFFFKTEENYFHVTKFK